MYSYIEWIRMDTLTASVYYGYSPNPNAADTDNTWYIKKVTTSGTVQSVQWANGSPSQQISIWSNRYNSFLSPTHSISITWSVTPNYNGISSVSSINLNWNLLNGVDQYNVIVSQNGAVYSDYGYPINNNQNEDSVAITSLSTSGSYKYKNGNVGTTYSVTVIGFNVAGSTSSTVQIGL